MMDNTQDGESIWAEFAGNSGCVPSSPSLKEYISGKTLLITELFALSGHPKPGQ
jgi:hypothetical protein